MPDRRFSIDKRAAEIFPVSFDFSSDLAEGETISSATILALDLSDGSDAAQILQGTYSINGALITQKIKAGAVGDRFRLTCRINTNAANIFEADLNISIYE